MTGQSQEASAKTTMMTHYLRRGAARKKFFQKKIPLRYIPQNDQRIVGNILSHMCWSTSGLPNLPRWAHGGPRHGTPEGKGGSGKGAPTTPPPVGKLFFFRPWGYSHGHSHSHSHSQHQKHIQLLQRRLWLLMSP